MIKSGMREHPLLKGELADRAFVCRSLHRLGLNNNPKTYDYSREYLDATSDLQILLGRLPWETQVLATIGADEVSECFLSWPDFAATWPKAVEIRQELKRRCLVT